MGMEGGLPHAGTNPLSRTFSPKAPSLREKDPVFHQTVLLHQSSATCTEEGPYPP